MTAAPASDEEGNRPGLRCPRCACTDLRTTHTRPVLNAVRRYKRCRHCGYKLTTLEQRLGDAARNPV